MEDLQANKTNGSFSRDIYTTMDTRKESMAELKKSLKKKKRKRRRRSHDANK